MTGTTTTPWFLTGNFAPVHDELTVHDLPVTGAIPPSLSGRYLRNGSNPKTPTSHWFFGEGMVHGIRLDGGRAEWYKNRWVRNTAGTQAVFDLGPDSYPGEFVFVQDDHDAGEDEGWAMGLVYDAATDSSDLVILDASAPGSEPVARVHLPRRVPFGFHGSWIDDAVLPET